MHKAILVFEHKWYGFDGDSSRKDTVVRESSISEENLNKLIEKEIKKNVSTDYGDFGLMTHQSNLISTDIFETISTC